MTIEELLYKCKEQVDKGNGNSKVMFDTESASFDVHLVSVRSAYIENIISDPSIFVLTFDYTEGGYKR